VAFAADGKALVSSGGDLTVRRWDASTGRELGKLAHPAVGAVLLLPDGLTAVSAEGHGFSEHVVYLFDLAAGKPVRYFEGHDGNVRAAAFSPDGRFLATGAERGTGTVRLWETAAWREVRQFKGGGWNLCCTALCFSPDGRTLAAGDLGGSLTLWDAATGAVVREVAAHRHNVLALAFSPDGKELVSGSYDGTVRVTELATGREVRSFRVEKEIAWGLALSADGRVAASGDQEQTAIHLWDVATGRELRTIDRGHGGSVVLALSPDGKTLAAGGGVPGLRLWEVATGQERRALRVHDFVNHLAFSPDGRFLAGSTQDVAQAVHSVHCWDLTAGRELPPRPGHRAWIDALAFSPDSRLLVSGSHDTTALVWSAADGPPPPPALDPVTAWSDLAGKPPVAYDAVGALAAAGDRGVGVIAKELRPAGPPADAAAVARLVADLNSDRFDVRDRAMRELEGMGRAAETGLRAALAAPPSAEARARLVQLLKALEGRRLQGLRALETLERTGSAEARRVLHDQAGGDPDDRLTREARACLERLTARHSRPPG
jgi:WD40 repeat protein